MPNFIRSRNSAASFLNPPRLIVLSILATFAIASHCVAETVNRGSSSGSSKGLNSGDAEDCRVKLKVIKGTNQQRRDMPTTMRWVDLPVELRGQLKSLPFTYYEVLSQAEKKGGPNDPAEFEINAEGLEPGHLVVQPVGRAPNASDLMVDWTNSEGEKLVSSKVHLADGNTWVMGMDWDKGAGSILCVRLDCQ